MFSLQDEEVDQRSFRSRQPNAPMSSSSSSSSSSRRLAPQHNLQTFRQLSEERIVNSVSAVDSDDGDDDNGVEEDDEVVDFQKPDMEKQNTLNDILSAFDD